MFTEKERAQLAALREEIGLSPLALHFGTAIVPGPRWRGRYAIAVGGCPCECNSGGFCGGCGHAGCGGQR